MRAKIKEEMVKYGKENEAVLEAEAVRDANNAYWMLLEESKNEYGKPDYQEIWEKWKEWFKEYIKRI